MRKLASILLVSSVAVLASAQSTSDSSAVVRQNGSSVSKSSQPQTEQASLQKSLGIIPEPPKSDNANWAKIKDLFM